MSSIKKTVTPEAVQAWIILCIGIGIAKTERDLAAKLGIFRQALYEMKRSGADYRTDLAMYAIWMDRPTWSTHYEKLSTKVETTQSS
jgi:hypothetical protein